MIDDVFAVIADPTRRQILRVLASGETPVGSLVDELGVSQPTVSKHLKVLRNAGLVTTRAQGQKRLYSLTPDPLSKVTLWIDTLNKMAGRAASASAHSKPVNGPASTSSQEKTEQKPTQSLDPATAKEAEGPKPAVEKAIAQEQTELQAPADPAPNSLTWQTAPVAADTPSLILPAATETGVLESDAEAEVAVAPAPEEAENKNGEKAEKQEDAPSLLSLITEAEARRQGRHLSGESVQETFDSPATPAVSEVADTADAVDTATGAISFTPLTPFTPVPVEHKGINQAPAQNDAAAIPALGEIHLAKDIETQREETETLVTEEALAELGEEIKASDFIEDEPVSQEETPSQAHSYQQPGYTSLPPAEPVEEAKGLLGAFSRLRRRRSR